MRWVNGGSIEHASCPECYGAARLPFAKSSSHVRSTAHPHVSPFPPAPPRPSLGACAALGHGQPQRGQQEAAERAPGAQQQAGVQAGREGGLQGRWAVE